MQAVMPAMSKGPCLIVYESVTAYDVTVARQFSQSAKTMEIRLIR